MRLIHIIKSVAESLKHDQTKYFKDLTEHSVYMRAAKTKPDFKISDVLALEVDGSNYYSLIALKPDDHVIVPENLEKNSAYLCTVHLEDQGSDSFCGKHEPDLKHVTRIQANQKTTIHENTLVEKYFYADDGKAYKIGAKLPLTVEFIEEYKTAKAAVDEAVERLSGVLEQKAMTAYNRLSLFPGNIAQLQAALAQKQKEQEELAKQVEDSAPLLAGKKPS